MGAHRLRKTKLITLDFITRCAIEGLKRYYVFSSESVTIEAVLLKEWLLCMQTLSKVASNISPEHEEIVESTRKNYEETIEEIKKARLKPEVLRFLSIAEPKLKEAKGVEYQKTRRKN